MPEEANTDNVFELGICMAGAVSAGAYTAGAMDYLIEALQTWEEKRNKEGVPSHRVVVKVIGGASAGGMTGIITASAINNPIPPISRLNHANIFEEQPQNKLYHTWVDLLHKDMFPWMLSNNDLSPGKVYSLVNSSFIDELSKRATIVDPAARIERPYFDNHLKFFVTLTNLEGFPYKTYLDGMAEDYHLTAHNDYAAFVLNKSDDDYANDGFTPVDFFTGDGTDRARIAAMATGAFPVGLKSRWLERNPLHVRDLELNHPLLQRFPPDLKHPYKALIVDGGTLNNEPFLKVRSLMNYDKDQYKGDHSIIMIDPFPSSRSDVEFEVKKDENTMLKVAGLTLNSVLSHARTKPELLTEMFDREELSVFQIAPKKTIDSETVVGSEAIACGFMEGFGGFLNKEFRIHDYFLGRANCERFLREHFTISAETTNPIFKNGYKNVDDASHRNEAGDRWQIIPLFNEEADNMYFPPFKHSHPDQWPQQKWKDIDKAFKRSIRKRVKSLAYNLPTDMKRIHRKGLSIAVGTFIGARPVLKYIEKQMQCHKLLIGYPPCKDKDDKK